MHLLLSDELRCDGGGRVEKVEGKGGRLLHSDQKQALPRCARALLS